MDLKLTRGDTHTITFGILMDDGNHYELQEGDKLYFTVKKSFFSKDCVLQKTFGDGITYNAETKEYCIELEQLCTCELDCGQFVYDIEIIINSNDPCIVKTLVKGNLIIDTEVTHKGNEV